MAFLCEDALMPCGRQARSSVFYHLMSHGLRKCLRKSAPKELVLLKLLELKLLLLKLLMHRVLLHFPEARPAWMGSLIIDSNSFIVICCYSLLFCCNIVAPIALVKKTLVKKMITRA